MASEWGYLGNPGPNNSWVIEILAVLFTWLVLGFQAAAWIGLGLTSWRILNIGKELV